MTNPVLQVFSRNVYGSPKVYPAPGCIIGDQFAKLLGVKTFSHAQLQQIEAMGYTITTSPDPIAWR